MSFDLGDTVEDIITGFRGILIIRYEHIKCETRYYVQPICEYSHCLPEGQYFSASQLKVIKKNLYDT